MFETGYIILFFAALFYIAIKLSQRQLDPFRVPIPEYVPKYVRHGGVLVDVFEHVVDSNKIVDLERADWETRADAWFEAVEFDEDEHKALKSWLASSPLSRDIALATFVEQEVMKYAKKEGVVRIYVDEFSTFVSLVGEPFVRITIYKLEYTYT